MVFGFPVIGPTQEDVQQVNMLEIKPKDLSLIPSAYTVKSENCQHGQAYIHKLTHIHNNIF